MSKDIWFSEMERLLADNEARGMSFDRAYDKACDDAHAATYERLADMADHQRKIAKGE